MSAAYFVTKFVVEHRPIPLHIVYGSSHTTVAELKLGQKLSTKLGIFTTDPLRKYLLALNNCDR